jgi:hypothetical protein
MQFYVRTGKELTDAQRDAEAIYESAVAVLRKNGFEHARFVPTIVLEERDYVGFIRLEKV